MLALSLLAVLGATVAAAPPAYQVMSFNIRYGTADDGENRWELRRSRTLAALKKRHPDLIGLQEALDFQVEELKALGYRSIGVGRDDGKTKGEYSAILYDDSRFTVEASGTFWLSDTPETVASATWGNHVVRICTWALFRDKESGKRIYHFNTHLDHESQPSREKSAELILKRIKERTYRQYPVILTGDFNAGEDNPAVVKVKSVLKDTFRQIHPEAQEVGTFTAFGEKPGVDKIDYIFIDNSLLAKDAEIVQDKVDGHWISDHLPVIATITYKSRG